MLCFEHFRSYCCQENKNTPHGQKMLFITLDDQRVELDEDRTYLKIILATFSQHLHGDQLEASHSQ